VIVKVAEDSIVLEADEREAAAAAGEDDSSTRTASRDGLTESAAEDLPRERGRVKWFDAEKGYGFLVRPTGEDLFVHHSEVRGDPSTLAPSDEVEYEVGRNDRGPNARRVRPIG
jgi:CspA family cold shock protein